MTRTAPLALGCLLLAAAGCSPYALRGRVIEGPVSAVLLVDKDDPRLTQGYGVDGVSIEATLDPDRLDRQRLSPTVSQYDGSFALPVDATGAGFLEYDVEVIAELRDYAPAVGQFRLPGRSRRLLVLLTPGEGEAPPRRSNLLEETMQLSEPYLRDR